MMSTTEANSTTDTEIEQTLNKTDLGHLIYEYRSLFISLIIASILSVSGFALWNQYQAEKELERSAQVFKFQSEVWELVQENKKEASDLAKSFLELDAKIQTSPTMVPLALEMVKFLFEKGSFTEAEQILAAVFNGKYHPAIELFLSLQRAVVLEKLDKVDDAIATLLPIAQKSDGIMASQVALELGRLYLVKGDKGNARLQFDHILNQYPNDEAAKMAGLYLMELAE